MTITQPPRLATALLRRLISGKQRESLIGDLIEQYQAGRSASWYWRQAVMAVLTGAIRDIRDHRFVALPAVGIGFTIYFLSAYPMAWLAQWLSGVRNAPLVWIENRLLETGHESLRLWLFGLPMWFPEAFPFISSAFSGWIVAQVNRRHAVGMVCAYTVSVLCFELLTLFVRVLGDSNRHSIALTTLLMVIALRAIGRPLGVLVGGLWSVSQEDSGDVEIAG